MDAVIINDLGLFSSRLSRALPFNTISQSVAAGLSRRINQTTEIFRARNSPAKIRTWNGGKIRPAVVTVVKASCEVKEVSVVLSIADNNGICHSGSRLRGKEDTRAFARTKRRREEWKTGVAIAENIRGLRLGGSRVSSPPEIPFFPSPSPLNPAQFSPTATEKFFRNL